MQKILGVLAVACWCGIQGLAAGVTISGADTSYAGKKMEVYCYDNYISYQPKLLGSAMATIPEGFK